MVMMMRMVICRFDVIDMRHQASLVYMFVYLSM